MAILKIEVCEVCKELDKPTRKYRVGDEGRLTRMPLCDEDAKPIRYLLDLKKPVRRAANVPVTMEQVKAKKVVARRKPPVVKKTR